MAYSAEDQKRVDAAERRLAGAPNTWGDSTRGVQEPTIEKGGGLGDTIERHPAFAQIQVNRVNGTTPLYGSDFIHHNFMSISISVSEMHRGLSRDWPFAHGEMIEVWLSEAQWAAFVSSPNSGQGVQCTMTHRDGKRIPGLPRPKDKTAQFGQEMNETLGDAVKELLELRERIVAGKGGKDSLKLLDKAVQEIRANTKFVAKQFGEHMETTVEKAKIEVNAYAQGTIQRLGLEAVARMPLELEHHDEGGEA